MKVIFDFARQQIGIEGDGPELVDVLQLARQIAPSLSNIQIATGGGPGPPVLAGQSNNENGTSSLGQPALHSGRTLRQFVKPLSLSSISERIAAIAYYKKTHEGRDTFSPKEMGDWFTICGLPKPNQMPVAVFDAKKRHGYLENVGRGKWKLTTNGENCVVGRINQASED